MSIDYRLTLAGDTPVEQVAARAFPELDDRPVGVVPHLAKALYEKYGFVVAAHGGENGYLDATSDDGPWEWEPNPYVSVSFSLDKFADRKWAVGNVAAAVHRVLATGSEDAAFDLNGDLLLLCRFGGKLVKHNRETWWSHYVAAEQLIPG